MLEDRRMLSVAGGTEMNADESIQLFSTSTALFVENQGQWSDEAVQYGFNGDGVKIAFMDEGLSFYLSQRKAIDEVANERDGLHHDLDAEPFDRFDDPGSYISHTTQFTVQFDGANNVTAVGLDQAETRFNYFVGDAATHRSNVAGYATVAYEDLYAGIDLHTFGRRDSLKYEFYVAPGADYQQISVSYDGIDGLWIDDAGALHVETELGELVDEAPYIYQMLGSQEVEITGAFALVDNDTYTFEITGEYDPNLELVIDPDLAWSSYLGGSSSDSSRSIAVDGSGNALVTGRTESSGWVSGGWDTSYNGGDWDAYVVKLSSSGEHLWSSYLGGNGDDQGRGIGVDASGNALVTGFTFSSGWVSGGWDTSYNGGDRDAFIVKLSSSGGHLWSSYLGGSSDWDIGENVAVDASGNVLVTGWTQSIGWVSGGWDTSWGGSNDGFVVKLSSSGGHVWSSYLGGSDADEGYGIAIDTSGNALVTGYTESSGWVSGGWDTSLGNGDRDAFVVKLSSSGEHVWSSYVGGRADDEGWGIAVDASGNALVTGFTFSIGWVSGGWDTSYSDPNTFDREGFVVKLSSSGEHLWSSYLGEIGSDWGFGIAVDGSGNALVTGSTGSSGWVSGGWDMSLGGGADGFVVKLSSSGGHLWSSYLGGSNSDLGWGIAVDGSGNALVAGTTWSSGWVSGGWDTSLGGDRDGFVAKFTLADPLLGDFNSDGDVDGADFLIWQRGYGIQTPNATKSDGDADDDMDVDSVDLTVWESQFGTGSASIVAAATTTVESASVRSLESEITDPTTKPLSAELVDAAIAIDQTLRSKSGARLWSHATLREDHFDWVPRRAKWGQSPAWRGTGEIANNLFRGQSNKFIDGRFYRDPDAMDVELLDELFAESGLVELL
jgi:hypothetical protein